MVVVSVFTLEVVSILKICADLSQSKIECLTIEITRPRSKSFLVSTCPRPPQSSPYLFTVFERVIDKSDADNSELSLLGDRNCNLLPDIVENNSSRLLNIMDIFGVTQLITEPIRSIISSMCSLTNLTFWRGRFLLRV